MLHSKEFDGSDERVIAARVGAHVTYGLHQNLLYLLPGEDRNTLEQQMLTDPDIRAVVEAVNLVAHPGSNPQRSEPIFYSRLFPQRETRTYGEIAATRESIDGSTQISWKQEYSSSGMRTAKELYTAQNASGGFVHIAQVGKSNTFTLPLVDGRLSIMTLSCMPRGRRHIIAEHARKILTASRPTNPKAP